MIATVVYSVFAGWQLYEIHSGAKDTHDLAVAAKTQAENLGNMSDAADKIRQAADGMVAQEQRIADNAKQSLDASNRQSKAALDAAITQNRVDQRAWVGATEMLPPPPAFTENGKRLYLKEGQQSVFQFYLANSGKTPASSVLFRISYRTLPASVSFAPRYPTQPTKAGVLQPGSKFIVESPATELATLTQIATYQTGTNILYFYGEIRYDDIFGLKHHTTFCVYMLRDLTGFSDCNTYNEAD
jgi:hypothetical protein